MGGSQNSSQLHTSFPPEIWGLITQYLSGEHIGRLKMTGSKILWQRLRAKRAVRSINFGKDSLIFKRWPAFVNELAGIEELEICNERRDWWTSWRPKLSQVPHTLRKLKLWSNKFLFKQTLGNFFVGSKNECLSLCEYVPELEVLQVRLHWCGKYTWMKQMPPNLTSLIVHKWTSTLALPDSLTHFNANKIMMIKSDTFRFPPQLESLSARDLFGFEFCLPALPPSIKSIVIERARTNTTTHIARVMNALPRSLMELDCHLLPSYRHPSEPVDTIFPPSLISFRFNNIPTIHWDRLPKSLKNLALTIDRFNLPSVNTTSPLTNQVRAVLVHPVHTLPSSLTALKLLNHTGGGYFPIFPAPEYNNCYFPPKLTTLTLKGTGLAVDTAKLLPSSLKELRLSRLDSCICEHPPIHLERLYADGALITPTLIAVLPKGLKFLKIDNSQLHHSKWNDPYTGEQMSMSEALSHLSKPGHVFWQQDATLPPTLTSVELHLCYGADISNFGDSFASQNLPNLTCLIIPCGYAISDRSIPYLSRNLRFLNLIRCEKVTGKCFPDLPRSLTVLSFGGEVEDEDVQHLPPSLIALGIISASRLTTACIAHLPRQLEDISFPEWTGCGLIEHLPKRISVNSFNWRWF